MITTRHFATIAVPGAPPRQVHYRRAGHGPPVLLLHQSPVSSAEYEHLMAQWGADFTLIAPDSPGFGLSDALPGEEPIIEPYAVAIAEFLDAIGVQKCGVYGTHTGAMIAAEFSRAYPHRCDVCVLNGYVVATDAEKADVMANYFVPLQPNPEGSHMVWAWVRMRDQMMFYPWYRKSAATRMTFDIPGPDMLQPFTMDYFRSANTGIRAYKAAFTYDAIKGLRGMTALCFSMAFEQDVLFEHLGRIPKDIPKCVRLEGHPTPMAVEARAREVFREFCKSPAPHNTATATIETRAWRAMAKTSAGQVYVRRSHMGSGKPLVLLHDAGQSSRTWNTLMQMLHGRKTVLAVDLPGHGETGALACGYDVESLANITRQALADLGVDACDVVAVGASCAVAVELSRLSPVEGLCLIDPWVIEGAQKAEMNAHFTPDLSPNWYGGHLVQAWAAARDSELFWPWFDTRHEASLKTKPNLDPRSVHHKALDLLKAQPGQKAFIASAVAFDWDSALSGKLPPITWAAMAQGPHQGSAAKLAAHTGSTAMALADDPSRYAAALAAMHR
jgi:haloalkane dehalogenase